MNTASVGEEFELRVLTGLQAGARLRLGPGLYRLGGADDCDIVLTGLAAGGHAAELEVDAQTLVLTPLAARCVTASDLEHEGPLELKAGKAFRIDDVWMALDIETAPWPAADSWLQPENAADEIGEPDEAPADDAPVDPPDPSAGTSKKVLFTTVLSLLALAALGFSGLWLFRPAPATAEALDKPTPAPQQAVVAAAPPPASAARSVNVEAQRKMLAGVLDDLGYTTRLSVEADPEGKLMLVGYLPATSDTARLQARLAKQHLKPVMHIVSDDLLKSRVEAHLLERAHPWTVYSVENGEIVLVGPAIAPDRLSVLERELRGAVGALRSISGIGRSLADADKLMHDLFAEIELSDRVKIEMDSGQIYVTGEADASMLKKVEEQLLRFHERFSDTVPFVAKFVSPRDKLPFRITQAVGGSMPYIVIDDGRRLYPGGSQDGYQLQSMRDRKIVFNGPQHIELEW